MTGVYQCVTEIQALHAESWTNSWRLTAEYLHISLEESLYHATRWEFA